MFKKEFNIDGYYVAYFSIIDDEVWLSGTRLLAGPYKTPEECIKSYAEGVVIKVERIGRVANAPKVYTKTKKE